MAGLIIIYEGITDLIHPNQLHKLDEGIYIVAFTAIVNFIVGTYCIRKGKRNNSIQLVAGGKHLQTDTWSTTGIIVGLALIWYTKLPWLDGVVALFFAGLILYTGYHILRRSIAGIMDEADRQLLQDLISYLNEHRRENWIDLHNLRVINMRGRPPRRLPSDCALVPHRPRSARGDRRVQVAGPGAFLGHLWNSSSTPDPCLDFSCRICTKQNCNVRKHTFEGQVEWTLATRDPQQKHHSSKQPTASLLIPNPRSTNPHKKIDEQARGRLQPIYSDNKVIEGETTGWKRTQNKVFERKKADES